MKKNSSYLEWQTSLWGAILASFAVGTLWGSYFKGIIYFILLLGAVLHAWGMYMMNRKK
jgi:hypothetical protein